MKDSEPFVRIRTDRHPATAKVWEWLEGQTYMDEEQRDSITRKLIELDIALHVLDLTTA